MKFLLWFVAATLVFVLAARYLPKSPAEPLIPTQVKEAQGSPEGNDNAPPARTEEQGEQDARRQEGGSTYVVPGRAAQLAAHC